MPIGDELTLGQAMNPLPVNPNVTPEEKQGLFQGWLQELQNPAVRAGLLQFGLQAMQPVPVQQTGAGAFAGAVGAGAEAYNRNIDEQNRVEQANIQNQFKEQDLATEADRNEVAREGNRQQYDVGMAGISAKNANAALVSQNRLIAAQIAAATRADVATQGALAEWASNEALYGRTATPESAKVFLDTINVGKGPALTVPGTEGARPSPSVETPLPDQAPGNSQENPATPPTLDAARNLPPETYYIDPDSGQLMQRGGRR